MFARSQRTHCRWRRHAYLPLSSAPAGSVVYASATDLFCSHEPLEGGISPAGEQVLSRSTIEQMVTPQVRLPSGSLADAFGLAFMLFDWGQTRVIGHDGATTGQNAYLRIVPGHDTAVALLTNGGFPAELFYALFVRYSRIARHPADTAPQCCRSARGFARTLLRRVRKAVPAHHGASRTRSAGRDGRGQPLSGATAELSPAIGGADTFVGGLERSPTPAVFHYLTTASGTQMLMTGGRVHPRRAVGRMTQRPC